jgi:hypothetical protein
MKKGTLRNPDFTPKKPVVCKGFAVRALYPIKPTPSPQIGLKNIGTHRTGMRGAGHRNLFI